MPRANRYFISGNVWHITHRCHKKEFLLKFAKDRSRWLHWLYVAKKRYRLCILNFVATSNHIHLLVKDTGNNAIPRTMQLVAGRVGQEYNQRKGRKGAFWEDRYHATAIGGDDHLARCMAYIDLNMVRAGVIDHPSGWDSGGYAELFSPRQRFRLTDRMALMELLGIEDFERLREARKSWVDEALRTGAGGREDRWTGSVAVGTHDFVEKVKTTLDIGRRGPSVLFEDGGSILKEEETFYRPLFGDKKAAVRTDLVPFE